MNASLPLFPLDASGQSASIPTAPSVAGVGSDDNAFAEQLTAAMAATTLGITMPVQQQATPSAVKPGIGLAAGQQVSGEPAGSPTLRAGDEPTFGATPERIDADSVLRPAAAEAAAGRARPGQADTGRQSADIVDPARKGLAGQASNDAVLAGIEDGDAFPSVHLPLRHAAVARDGRAAGRREDTAPGSSGTDRQPVTVSSSLLGNTLTATEAGRNQPADVDPAIEAPGLPGRRASKAALDGSGPDQGALSRSTLFDPSHRQPDQSAGSPTAGRASLISQPDLVQAAPPRSVPVNTDLTIVHPSPTSDRTILTQRQSDALISPADIHGRGDHAALTIGRPDMMSPATRRSPGDRGSEPATGMPAQPSLTQSTQLPADSGYGPARASKESQPARSSISVIEQRGPSTPAMTHADKAAQIAAGDVGLIQAGTPEGIERLQPVSQLEGLARDVQRLDATTNINPTKPQTPAAHPSASTQVALQIVRSLPDGVDRLSVHLQPADLGSVDIQLTFDGTGRLSALIAAERPETLELLQRDSRLLERGLGDSGLKLSNDGLSFALKQDQQQHQQGQNFHEQAHARRTAFQAGRAYDGAPETELLPPTRQIEGRRLLDIRT